MDLQLHNILAHKGSGSYKEAAAPPEKDAVRTLIVRDVITRSLAVQSKKRPLNGRKSPAMAGGQEKRIRIVKEPQPGVAASSANLFSVASMQKLITEKLKTYTKAQACTGSLRAKEQALDPDSEVGPSKKRDLNSEQQSILIDSLEKLNHAKNWKSFSSSLTDLQKKMVEIQRNSPEKRGRPDDFGDVLQEIELIAIKANRKFKKIGATENLSELEILKLFDDAYLYLKLIGDPDIAREKQQQLHQLCKEAAAPPPEKEVVGVKPYTHEEAMKKIAADMKRYKAISSMSATKDRISKVREERFDDPAKYTFEVPKLERAYQRFLQSHNRDLYSDEQWDKHYDKAFQQLKYCSKPEEKLLIEWKLFQDRAEKKDWILYSTFEEFLEQFDFVNSHKNIEKQKNGILNNYESIIYSIRQESKASLNFAEEKIEEARVKLKSVERRLIHKTKIARKRLFRLCLSFASFQDYLEGTQKIEKKFLKLRSELRAPFTKDPLQ